MQSVEGLENNLDAGMDIFPAEHLRHLIRDVFVGKGRIDVFHTVDDRVFRLPLLLFSLVVRVDDDVFHAPADEQLDSHAKSDELAHARHVDAVVIGVSDLRRRGNDNDLFGMQAVEDADDALAEGRSAHDAVVDDHEVIDVRRDAAVGNVINVCGQIVAGISLGDEGAQFDVFEDHLLAADALREDSPYFFLAQ